jgi:hypothetical protein
MPHALFAALYAITLLLAAPAAAQQQTDVVFAPGRHTVTLTGAIKGDADHGYLVAARAGQLLTVDFKPTNASAYINIIAPDSTGEALFVGSSSGNHFAAPVPADGSYRVLVYLMRNAARRNEVARYTLRIDLRDASAAVMSAASMPAATAPSAGDALVPGTPYHATADITCTTSAGGRPAPCKAGVIRRAGGTTTIELTTPDGGHRRIFFTNGQATGSDAAAGLDVRRQGDLQIIRIGAIEVYRVPDAFVVGG